MAMGTVRLSRDVRIWGRNLARTKGRITKRLLCPGCKAELTATDIDAGYCTQCGLKLGRKKSPERESAQWWPEVKK